MGLFINSLADDEKYPVLNRDNLTIPIQMKLSEKQKDFSNFFEKFLKSSLNFEYFQKKMTLTAFVFPKLRTLKTELHKYLKSPISEEPLTINIVNVRKHCSNLRHGTFIIFNGNC